MTATAILASMAIVICTITISIVLTMRDRKQKQHPFDAAFTKLEKNIRKVYKADKPAYNLIREQSISMLYQNKNLKPIISKDYNS